jgi:hypothetical protein
MKITPPTGGVSLRFVSVFGIRFLDVCRTSFVPHAGNGISYLLLRQLEDIRDFLYGDIVLPQTLKKLSVFFAPQVRFTEPVGVGDLGYGLVRPARKHPLNLADSCSGLVQSLEDF